MKKNYQNFKRIIITILILIQIAVIVSTSAKSAEGVQDNNIVDKLKIGAFVNYTPKTTEESNGKYVFPSKYTGFEQDQEISVEDLKTWRILNVNKEEGTIDIISGNPTSQITFKGAQGYNNGVYLLNQMCKELYGNSNLQATARSINELDILEHIQSDSLYKNYTEYDDDGNIKYKFGNRVDYAQKGAYPTQWINDDTDTDENYLENLNKDRELLEPENEKGGSWSASISAKGTYYQMDNWNTVFKTVPAEEQININGIETNIYRDILFFGDDWSSDNYWLATRFVDTRDAEQVIFGMPYSHSNIVKVGFGGSANWWSGVAAHGIKPIVTIPISQIDIDADDRDGTKERPFKLGQDETKTTITFKDENLYNEVLNQVKDKISFEKEEGYLSIVVNKSEINKITKLELNNKEITDITGLKKFTGLTELNISGNSIGDISQLSTLTNLKILRAHGCTISDITPLMNLTNLEVLDISNNKITDTEDNYVSDKIKGLVNLQELNISHNYLKYTKGLEQLTNLRNLNLFDNAIHNLNGLENLSNLESLNLGENNENKAGSFENISAIKTLTNLKELNFATNFTPEIIDNIESLVKLEKLDLSRNNIEDISKLSNLTKLKELNLALNSINTITPLIGLTDLENLNIQNNVIPTLEGILSNNELVWKNMKKLSIAANYKLYSKSAEIVYLRNRALAQTIELNYENIIEDTSNLPHIDSNGIKYVTYDDFGARCNGEYDDWIAIRNTHTFANKYNYEVRATAGKTYHIFKYTDGELNVKTNVDWNNATFIVHDEEIDNMYARFQRLFRFSSNIDDNDKITITNPTWTIGKNTKKITNISDELHQLNEKGYKKYLCVVENTNKKQFIRYGTNANSGYNQQDSFIIDSEGNVLNDIVWDFETITKFKILPIPNEKGYIRNGHFITNSLESESEANYSRPGGYKSIYYQRCLMFWDCANMDISGIKHELSKDELSGSYYGFIYIDNCADISLLDSHLFARKYSASGRSTYDLSMHTSVNVLCKNITSDNILDVNRWGITGTKFLKDVVYEDCTINRIDAHEGIYNLTVKDCTLGAYGVGVVGFGTLNIINTKSLTQSLLGLRGDYGTFWDGDVNIIDCTFTHHSKWAWSLFYTDIEAVGVGHDFGYKCMFPNVYIENLTIDCQYKPDNNTFLMFPLWNKTYAQKVPESYWNSKIQINGFKFINTNVEDPKLKLCTLDLEAMKGNYIFTNTKLIDSEGNDLTHKFNKEEKIETDKSIKLTINKNATAKNNITIYKDDNVIVDNITVEDVFEHEFKEEGKYKIKLDCVENTYNKTGEKIYEFEIKKQMQQDENENKEETINPAFEIVKNMKVGYNIGNSLDAMIKEKGFYPESETLWSNPKITREQIDKVKEMGFTSIRIPVSYYNHLDENGIIDPDWLARVKTVVDYAYDNDLYVIINVHHDAGMDTKFNWIFADVDTYEEDLANIKNLWSQIAPYFKDYDNKLLFEFHNEIMNRDSNWDWNTQTDDFKLVHDMDQELINLVRTTGGNNSTRFLITSTWGASSDSRQVESLMYKEYEDTIENHLIMEVHNYYDNEEKIEKLFERLKESSNNYNIPIIIGESGTKANKVDNESRVKLAETFSKCASENGMALFWWDNGQSNEFDLFSRKTLETTHQDIIDGLIKYYDDDNSTYVILEGENQEYSSDKENELTIRASGEFEKFVGLKIDDITLDKSNYTAKSGSTIVTLKPSYLNTLSEGKHKLTFIYTDGEVSTNFTIIKASQNPDNIEDTENTENNDNNDNNDNTQNENNNNQNEQKNSTGDDTIAKTKLPNTGDNIKLYIIMFISSIIGLILLIKHKKANFKI